MEGISIPSISPSATKNLKVKITLTCQIANVCRLAQSQKGLEKPSNRRQIIFHYARYFLCE